MSQYLDEYSDYEYNRQSKEIDYFDNQKELPNEVQEILKEFEDMDNTYENCERLVERLRTVGWTCDYYLDAEPYNLRKCTA